MSTNTGNRSTGDCSTGDWSTGDWSTGNYSTGHFSTIDYSGYGAFNQHCTHEEWETAIKPKFIFFRLTEWIPEENMTKEEKGGNPQYETAGGYLKIFDYKEAWRNAWDSATNEDKELLYKLPNFDKAVFKEISGIDVDEDTIKTIVLDGEEIKISKESFEALKNSLLKKR